MRERPPLKWHKREPYGLIDDEATDEFGVALCGTTCGKPSFPIVPVLTDDLDRVNCARCKQRLDALEQEERP